MVKSRFLHKSVAGPGRLFCLLLDMQDILWSMKTENAVLSILDGNPCILFFMTIINEEKMLPKFNHRGTGKLLVKTKLEIVDSEGNHRIV